MPSRSLASRQLAVCHRLRREDFVRPAGRLFKSRCHVAAPTLPALGWWRHPDEGQLMFLAFDLLHQDGVDLRGLPLSERKRDLHRLCSKSWAPFLQQVQIFPGGAVLLEHCNNFGFEGVVSKRLSIALCERAKPALDEIEVPELEARQRRALPSVRDAKETAAKRARTGTKVKAGGACSRA